MAASHLLQLKPHKLYHILQKSEFTERAMKLQMLICYLNSALCSSNPVLKQITPFHTSYEDTASLLNQETIKYGSFIFNISSKTFLERLTATVGFKCRWLFILLLCYDAGRLSQTSKCPNTTFILYEALSDLKIW
jgi:hypothetical protein